MQLVRTTNQDEPFVALTRQLDTELRQRYGQQQDLYTPHNRLDLIDTALLGVVMVRLWPAAVSSGSTLRALR